MDTASVIALVLFVVATYFAIVFALSVAEGYKRAGMSESPLNVEQATNEYSSGGKRIKCAHCSGTRFREKQAQLNTWFATFLNFDWLNRSATALTCFGCGHIMWFAQKPTRK